MPALGLSIRLRYRISSQDNSNARTAWVHFFTWHSWHSEVSLWPWVQECFLKDKKSLCLKPLSKGPTRSAVTVWQLYLFSLLVINYCFNQFHFILGPIKGSCTKKGQIRNSWMNSSVATICLSIFALCLLLLSLPNMYMEKQEYHTSG